MNLIETTLEYRLNYEVKIMESIGYFFGRVFGGFIDRLSDQMRYKISDIAESKIRETVEKPFNQSTTHNQQTTTDRQEQNTKRETL
jgi:hypothetical protein